MLYLITKNSYKIYNNKKERFFIIGGYLINKFWYTMEEIFIYKTLYFIYQIIRKRKGEK